MTPSRRAAVVMWQVGRLGTAAQAVPPWVDALGFHKSPTHSSCYPGGQVSGDPLCQLPQPVTLTKAVRDRLSLIHQITSPKAVSALWKSLQLLPFCLPWSFPHILSLSSFI